MLRLTATKNTAKRAENKAEDEAETAAGIPAMMALPAATAVLFSPYAPLLICDSPDAESGQIYGFDGLRKGDQTQ